MLIQSASTLSSAYAAFRSSPVQRQISVASPENSADKVTISAAAAQALAAESSSAEDAAIQQRLDAIKAKSALEKTADDMAFLLSKDKKMAELHGRDPKTWRSADLDYVQKATGFVNTMSALSTSEKAMYDDMVAQGNWEAAQGLGLVAMSRIGLGGEITLPNGKSFDPKTTDVTAASIRNLFRYAFVDSAGQTDRQFDALASYLEQRESVAATKA